MILALSHFKFHGSIFNHVKKNRPDCGDNRAWRCVAMCEVMRGEQWVLGKLGLHGHRDGRFDTGEVPYSFRQAWNRHPTFRTTMKIRTGPTRGLTEHLRRTVTN